MVEVTQIRANAKAAWEARETSEISLVRGFLITADAPGT